MHAETRVEVARLSPKREGGVWRFHEHLRAAYAEAAAMPESPR